MLVMGEGKVRSIEAALTSLRVGGPPVVLQRADGEDGALVLAAAETTAGALNFLTCHGGGLVMVALPEEWLERLDLPPSAAVDDGRGWRPSIGVDLRPSLTGGISASDRARTVRALADRETLPTDLTRPGHVFPLGCRPGGALESPTAAETAIDLARLAGHEPAAVICRVLDRSGELAGAGALTELAARHDLPTVSIEDVVAFRLRRETWVSRAAESIIPIGGRAFRAVGYADDLSGAEHLALTLGDPAGDPAPTVHVHEQCLAGDALGSLACTCRVRLRAALESIAVAGRGVLVYLGAPEGRARLGLDGCGAGRLPRVTHDPAAQILADLEVVDPDLDPTEDCVSNLTETKGCPR